MWGTILSAGASQIGSIVGGVLDKKAADKADQTNRDLNGDNINMQREFAQNGVRWKVADAKAAGVHPLVALGAPTASFSPSSIGATPDRSMGDMARNMGQDISRAVSATQTSDQRTLNTLQIQGAQLDIEGKALDNQIKNSQLSKMSQVGPAFPTKGGDQGFISGQSAGTNRIKEKQMERTMSLKGAPQSEPGAIPDVGWAKTATGVVPIPSADVKNRIEDIMPHEWAHYFRNNIAPMWGGGTLPPSDALPSGAEEWRWNPIKQEFQPYFLPKSPPARRDPDLRHKNWNY